jgi:hypothetical protein
MYVHLESLNKKRLNLFWLNFSKDRSLSRAGTVDVAWAGARTELATGARTELLHACALFTSDHVSPRGRD